MKKTLFILTIVALFAACSSTYNTVYSDYGRSVDFTKFKTFAWLPDKADTINSPYNNEIIRNNIRNYFGLCMSDRAYKVDLENPDLLLQIVITNSKKERTVSTLPSTYYYRPYYYGSYYYSPYRFGYYYNRNPSFGYGYSGGLATTQKQEYVNGAITLNFIDAKTKKLVWSGTAEGDIYDPSQISKNIHPAVHNILDQYPVKPLEVNRSHKIK